MPIAYFKTPIGFVSITEEDGFISSVYMLDGEFEVDPPETPLLKKAIQQLDEYFKGERRDFDLPLKQQGSDFQQQVWDQLSKLITEKPSATLTSQSV